jgi:hypothetical protein
MRPEPRCRFAIIEEAFDRRLDTRNRTINPHVPGLEQVTRDTRKSAGIADRDERAVHNSSDHSG